MKEITSDMIKIYETYEYDWMDYLIIDNELTFHHIKKKEDAGLFEMSNGALLTPRAHNYLHFIERVDKDIYLRLNEVFQNINLKKDKINKNQKLVIEYLLLKFEINNADRIIKRKEKLGKNRVEAAIEKRKIIQRGGNICQIGQMNNVKQ